MGAKAKAIEVANNLKSMSIDSLVNSLTFYKLKLKSKVQDEEKGRIDKCLFCIF